MRTSLACLCCGLVMIFTCRGRDLAGYDTLGPLVQRPTDPTDSTVARVRDFVWQHWMARRLGHAVVTCYNREGEASVFDFCIEPDTDGTWEIIIDGEHERSNRAVGNLKSWRETSHRVAREVERLRNYEGEYYFKFRDASGKVVSTW